VFVLRVTMTGQTAFCRLGADERATYSFPIYWSGMYLVEIQDAVVPWLVSFTQQPEPLAVVQLC
jgi:hypothetical protein